MKLWQFKWLPTTYDFMFYGKWVLTNVCCKISETMELFAVTEVTLKILMHADRGYEGMAVVYGILW